MAVVRINQAIRDSVIVNAIKIFSDQLSAAKELELPATCTAQTIYDRIFAPWKDSMMVLPTEIVPRAAEFQITRVWGEELNYTFTLVSPHPMPTRLPKSEHVAVDGFMSARYKLHKNPDVDWCDIHQATVDRAAKVKAVELRVAEFVDGVKTVINNHTTLAPALKAWPPLWDLIPEYVKDRHKEVVDRKPASPAPEIDIAKLTSIMTISKLTR